MDPAIREQLLAAESRRDAQALKNAYELIKAASQGKSALHSSDHFSTDLYVLCAEQAFQLGYLEMSSDCLQMYFKGKFPVNQFLGRAYLCQGQLHTPLSTDNLEEFEWFVLFFMKAIEFATHDQRYYFLIYNASVLYCQLVRPFLQPGFRYCLIPSLAQIVKALNQAEEPDREWRAELMVNLLECFIDASKLEEAKEFSSTAAIFIKEHVPDKYSQIFSLMVYHKLLDISQVEKEIQNSIHLAVIYKMQMLKLQWDTDEFPSDAAAHLNSVYVLLRQCDGPPALLPGVKIPLILELARFSMKVNCVELARACILDLKRAGLTEQGKLIEIGCLEREYEVKKVGANVTYTKGVAEAQLELITSLEVTLKHAVQLGDPGVIQVVCTTLWNVCFPLLQHSLHQRVRKPLAAVADALEEIDSVLVLLRCQVHTELARIEEDEDRMEAAMEHVQKAVCLARSGQCREHLRLTLNRLRAVLYPSPERLEDRAAVLMEQAKRREQKDDMRKKRALLVNAGHALAPDSFQTVLDSENEAKVAAGKSRSEISCLCARAQHHIKSVERVDEHLKLLQNENSRERIILWADLAKVARAQEVWDVCRAACRFCLCYDDALFRRVTKPRQAQKRKGSRAVLDADRGDSLPGQSSLPAKSSSAERHLLRTLAEIRLLSAEATVHLLRLQGIELNDHAVPPEETSHSHPGYVSHLHESDPEWKTYSLWIDCLSQYAMDNFHRAAEIGKELNEAWIVHNAVVHVLNYNRHLISSGRQREIIECLQTLLGAIRTVGYNGSTAVLLMLCNALARGLILCWIPKPRLAAKDDTDAATDRSRKAAAKRHKKANIIQSSSVDPRGLPDVRAALEICEFALTVPTEAPPGEAVPVAAQQQIIATWVKAKQLNRQQIEHNLGAEEENNDEAQNPLARILVGLEMYSCNGLGLLDFAVPSLSQLVKLAVECSWSDSLVELQTLTRLMYFAYVSRDHEMVMACSKKILQSDENFCHTGDIKECDTARREMVSTAACIQGRSMMENSPGGKHVCVAASKAFVQSARNAGEAGNYSLAMSAARHFWNACLPLLGSPHDRKQFKEPTEVILQNIIKAESKNKQEKKDMLPLHQWITKDFQSIGSSGGSFLPGAEEDLALRTSLYGLLFHIYADKADWDTALQVLDEAITVLPQTRHMLLIFKHMATAKAALGCDFMMDVQKLRDEGEDYLSRVWRRLGAVSRSTAGQLSCFQNAVVALQKQENDWQKVNYLMEFAEWLYCNQFPISDVTKALDWVVDLLLHMEFSMRSSQEEGKTTIPKFSPTEYLRMDIGASDTTPQINLEDLRNIKHLEALFRAQTLMALVSGQGSPVHQQHCLLACACVVRIWQVALAASGPLTKVLSKPSQLAAPQKSVITPKPEKDRKKEKQVDLGAVREKLKERGSAATLPANVEEWAEYDCPREIRDTFKHETNSHGINRDNFPKPTCTLYFMELLSKELQKIFCPHLVLPIFQLAEVLAGEVVECRSLSDLYHLRIALVCSELQLDQASLYHEKAAGEAHLTESEQTVCWQEIALRKANQVRATAEEGELFFENARLKVVGDENCLTSQEKFFELNAGTGTGLSALSFPYLWMEKAEVLLRLGACQPAGVLLSEAHAAAQELGALCDVSRCLYLLAVLAKLEGSHGQARALLEKAQLLGGSEQFWYSSTLVLVGAILEEEEEGKQSMACETLERTVNVLRAAFLQRPNRQAELGFMITSLEARKTLIQIHLVPDCATVNAEPCQLPHGLQESYSKLVQLEKDFSHYGHKTCSAEMLLERANIHRMIAKQERRKAAKHSHYLDASNLAQRAVSTTEEVFHGVCSLCAVNETTNISIPLMRQLANRKINFVEILLDIFHLVITEKKLEVGEASWHTFVEAFTREASEDDAAEQGWKRMECAVAHIILAQLANVQELSTGCAAIRSKCLYLAGKTLRLLAMNRDPVQPKAYWKLNVTKDHKLSQNYLSQSSEALLQGLGVAFRHGVTDVLAPAGLEMVECFQQFDPVSTSQFLAVHQSCSASVMMKSILLTAASHSSSSLLAALLHLQNHLSQNRNARDRLKNVEQQLAATSAAWRNLCVPVEHFSIMEELPLNFCVIILQHSEDRSDLYGSVVWKPKASAQQKGKPAWPTVHAGVCRHPVDPDTFGVLLDKVRLYKQQQMQRRLQQPVTQNSQGGAPQTDVTPPEKTDADGHDGTSDFSEILEIMEDYLKPVLTQLDFSDIREQSTAVLAAESRKIQVKDKDTRHTRMQGTSVGSGLCVVLLADTLFMELPLEALSIFGEEGISSVSRDFSLQFLYNRVHVAEAESGVNTAVQRSKGTKPKSKPHQKKNVRMAPVSRDLPSDCLPVDARRFKYLVDPYNEGIEAGAVSPSQKVKEILEKHHGLFPLQWQGVTGNSCVPGQAGWEQLLSDCSAFLFYGMERFLSHVSPARLVAMNIPECRLVMLLDLVRSEKSYRRIRNSDTHKSCLPTAVEGPTEAAALLSLAGARSIIANQWYTTLQENAERLEILSENLLSVGRTTGQTVRILQKGKVHRDGDPTEAEAESHSSPGGKAEERRSHPSSHLPATHPSFFNCVLYGLPTAIMM